MRVIASVYTGSTERRALDELVGLGAKVKVSYETSQTRSTPRRGSSAGHGFAPPTWVVELTHSALSMG